MSDITLVRTGQVARKLEAVEGTAETLTAAEVNDNVKAQGHTYTPGEYERELERPTLSTDPALKGAAQLAIKYVTEMVGGGAAAAAPWHTELRGVGFGAGTQLKVVTIGTITGDTFTCGDRIGDNATEGSATVTGTAVCMVGADKLVYVPGTGAFDDTDTVHNYTATGTSAPVDSAPANAGYRFRPVTESEGATIASLTVQRIHNGEVHLISGARGTAKFSMRMNEPMLMEVEFQGPPELDEDGNPETGTALTGVTQAGTVPKVCKSHRIRIGAYTPVLTSIEVDMGITLAPRGTIADDDISASGYKATRISDRLPKLTIDPEYSVTPGELDQVSRTMRGATFSWESHVGDPADANGLVILYGPRLQLMGPTSDSERDKIKTAAINATFRRGVGGSDDEISLFHVFVAA